MTLIENKEEFNALTDKKKKAYIKKEFGIDALTIRDLPLDLPEDAEVIKYLTQDTVTFWQNTKTNEKVRRVVTQSFLGTPEKYLILVDGEDVDHSMINHAKVRVEVSDTNPEVSGKGYKEISVSDFYSKSDND